MIQYTAWRDIPWLHCDLQAAKGAGMRCIITYTHSTKSQHFPGAERIVASLGDDPAEITVADLINNRVVQVRGRNAMAAGCQADGRAAPWTLQDDRIEMDVSAF